MSKYNLVSLFCGCGGLDKGFEQSGFNIVVSNDIWESALKTYDHNFNHTAICGDITEKKTKQIIFDEVKKSGKRIDCLIGGPPCQAYSISGNRDPNDKRGQLFNDYISMVNSLQPTVVVMENVKGILSIKQARDDLNNKEKDELQGLYKLNDRKQKLLKERKKYKNEQTKKESEGLDLLITEINKITISNKKTSSYLDLLITKLTISNKKNASYLDLLITEINTKLTILNKKIKKTKKKTASYLELVTDKIIKKFDDIGYNIEYKVLNSADYSVPQRRERVIFIGIRKNTITTSERHPIPTHTKNTEDNTNLHSWKTVREAISYLEDKQEDKEINHIMSRHTDGMVSKIKKVKIGTSLYKSYGDAFHKCDPDKPSRTVKENHGGVFLHYKNPRCMTPRELAELQSFPKDFIFKGSKSEILKQIGNAVPVGLGKAIGGHIHKLLDDYYN